MESASNIMKPCIVIATGALALFGMTSPLQACPFCQLLEEKTVVDLLDESGAVTITKLTRPSMSARDRVMLSFRSRGEAAKPPTSAYEATQVLEGAPAIAPGQRVEVPFPTKAKVGSLHLLCAPEAESPAWLPPIPLTEDGLAFIETYRGMPRDFDKSTEAYAERLAFFLKHVGHGDPVLETAAYGEFAKAPYDAVTALTPLLDRAQILEWLGDEDAQVNRQRLYLVLLGLCGTGEDIPLLTSWLRSEEKRNAVGSDALIACYLSLRGEDGLETVEDMFLKGENLNQSDIYATVAALEFHSSQEDIIPKERLVDSFRLVLNHPGTAELAIPHLALLGDWESIPRLVDLYKAHSSEFGSIKEPVILFLRTCPLPEAEARLSELESLDPDLVRHTEGNYSAEDIWGTGAGK